MPKMCMTVRDVFVPVTIQENDLFGGVAQVLNVIRPKWEPQNIKYKLFTDGITNKLVACQHKDDSNEKNIVLVRIYGNKTDLLIDRTAELRNIKALNVLGLAPQVYGVFQNGLAYEYYPGVTLNTDTVIDPNIWPLVARQMAKMHKVNLGKEVKKEPNLWDKIEQFLRLLPEKFSTEEKHNRFVKSFGSVTRLRIEMERLRSLVLPTSSPVVFAHNDLLLGNVVYDAAGGTVAFIDYEYATYNYQAYDIANHFNEFVGISVDSIDYTKYPDKSFRSAWVQCYLEEFSGLSPDAEAVERVLEEVRAMSLASHFLWGVWSLVQFELSNIDFDFGRYAEIRINKYYELKENFSKHKRS